MDKRTLKQLNEENKSLREIELEEINNLDVPQELKDTLIKILDDIEDEMGSLDEKEKEEITKYIKAKHEVREKKEKLIIEMLQKCGIKNLNNVDEGVKEIQEKGYSLINYVDDSLESKVLNKYSVEDKEGNTLAYFYEITEETDSVEAIKFSKVIMGEE